MNCSHIRELPGWDTAATELAVGSSPAWNSPEHSPLAPTAGSETPLTEIGDNQGYRDYCENIQEEGGAFYQIGLDIFVVSGWDAQRKVSKASQSPTNNLIDFEFCTLLQSSWYHLQRSTIGVLQVNACQCPLSRPDNPCVHQRFLTDYGDEVFPFDTAMTSIGDNAVLFSRQELQEGVFLNHFSSPSSNTRSLAGRVIVTHTGEDTGIGQWVCAKDAINQGCPHIAKCRDLLQKLVQADPTAIDEGLIDGSSNIDYSVPRQRRGPLEQKSVSYLPILPPAWASLPSDPPLYQRAPALVNAPETLRLDSTSSCCCSESRLGNLY
ncbi:hypothetical protein R3P38DRAFT_3314231 [Favolaschia claudopus]|uniref:SWIM-type domain-containing protein n=1 Tax=Favolaschia claudopus TaxID=2862362 RepID=A0AAW0BUG5_9AGAR